MPSEMGPQEGKAVLAAGAAAAAALFTAAFYFGPATFGPWPLALAVLAISGAAGAVSTWATSGHEYALPLAVLLLPLERLALAAVRHGRPPWRFTPSEWLMGDEFPLWVGGALLAAAYAGMLIRCHLRATSAYQAVLAKRASIRAAEAERTAVDAAAAGRIVLVPLAIGALYASLAGGGESFAVRAGASAFLLAGMYYSGLVNARSKQAIWLARGVETRPGLEAGWFRGHAVFFLILLGLVPALPGGFQPFDPRWLIALLGRERTAPPRLPDMTRAGLLMQDGAVPRQGFLAKAFDIAVGVCLAALLAVAIAVIIGVALFILHGLGTRLAGWWHSLSPLWAALGRFCRAILALLRGRLAGGLKAMVRPIGRLLFPVRTRPEGGLRRRIWPASRVRRLFAQLVLRGREAGLRLPTHLSPSELGAGLAELIPELQEDLSRIVEVYCSERYGETKPGRGEHLGYRRAWARAMRAVTAKPAPAARPSERDGEDGT